MIIILYHACLATTSVRPRFQHSWPASQYPDHAPGSRVGRHRVSHYRYMTMIMSPLCRQRDGRDAAFNTRRVGHSTHTYPRTNFARTKQIPGQRRISSTRAPLGRTTYFCQPTHPIAATQHKPEMRTRGISHGWVVEGGGYEGGEGRVYGILLHYD